VVGLTLKIGDEERKGQGETAPAALVSKFASLSEASKWTLLSRTTGLDFDGV
jgi:hypothetical protein